MQRFMLSAALAATTLLAPLAVSAQETTPGPYALRQANAVQKFSTEDAAQQHCPSDSVVWLNTHSGVWHVKGAAMYGKTKHGAYVCKSEAGKSGYHQAQSSGNSMRHKSMRRHATSGSSMNATPMPGMNAATPLPTGAAPAGE